MNKSMIQIVMGRQSERWCYCCEKSCCFQLDRWSPETNKILFTCVKYFQLEDEAFCLFSILKAFSTKIFFLKSFKLHSNSFLQPKLTIKLSLARETNESTCDVLCRLFILLPLMTQVKKKTFFSSKMNFLLEGRGGTRERRIQ